MKIQNQLPIQRSVQDQDEKIMAAAKMYEQQFMQEMQKAMKKTVDYAEKPSMATEIFKDQLDQQYLEKWSDRGGVGLADIIYNQIKERYFNKPMPRPQGPLPVDPKAVVPQSDDRALNFKIEAPKTEGKNATDSVMITNPWDGVLKSQTKVGNINLLTLRHDSGVSSRVAFSGNSPKIPVGTKVEAGAVLGQLSPSENQVQWRITDQG